MKKYIVIHHSLTEDSGTVSWGAIRKYHMNEKGWRDIGYHFGIELVNDAYEVFAGRMPDIHGAHCEELHMNEEAYGICVVGNFDMAAPRGDQVKKLIELCRYLIRLDKIPVPNVLGHREVGLRAGFDWQKGQYKSCPGKLFDMKILRGML